MLHAGVVREGAEGLKAFCAARTDMSVGVSCPWSRETGHVQGDLCTGASVDVS
jgi:hypothetical protein